MKDIRFTSPVVSSGDNALARFAVTGLDQLPGVTTKYYCQLMDPVTNVLFGEVFSGWTRMTEDDTVDYTFDIVLGSCLSGAKYLDLYGSDAALADAVALGAPLLLHLGDWGYWGQTIEGLDAGGQPAQDLKKYIGTMNDPNGDPNFAELRKLVDGSNIEGCISDHELHANGDQWQPSDHDGDEDGSGGDNDGDEHDAFGCQHSLRQMQAHKRLFPVANWGDGVDGTSHRGYYLDIAPHVRLVVSDFRSPQRNESTDQDGGPNYKQMWGKDQETWLYETAFDVDTDTVILFVNETVWWRRADQDVTDDKPASYPDAQDVFMQRLTGTGKYEGYTPIIDRFVWLGGDRHYCGYLSRADAQKPGHDGFPQFIGSGFCKNSLLPHSQEDMSWRSPVRPDQYAWFPVVGYMQLTLSYDHTARIVTLTGRGRIVEKTHRELYSGILDGGLPTVSLDPGSGETFTLDDVGMTITGHFVQEQAQGSDEVPDAIPAIIESVDLQANTATMDLPAKGAGHHTGVTLAIGTDRTQWFISTHPTILQTTETFQV